MWIGGTATYTVLPLATSSNSRRIHSANFNPTLSADFCHRSNCSVSSLNLYVLGGIVGTLRGYNLMPWVQCQPVCGYTPHHPKILNFIVSSLGRKYYPQK